MTAFLDNSVACALVGLHALSENNPYFPSDQTEITMELQQMVSQNFIRDLKNLQATPSACQ